MLIYWVLSFYFLFLVFFLMHKNINNKKSLKKILTFLYIYIYI